MWEARKNKLYGNDSCPSKLQQSQRLAENLDGTEGKFEVRTCKSLSYVNKGNVNVNEGKELLLVGLVVWDNNCVQVDSSSAHCWVHGLWLLHVIHVFPPKYGHRVNKLF